MAPASIELFHAASFAYRPFSCNATDCTTALGRWLAQTVSGRLAADNPQAQVLVASIRSACELELLHALSAEGLHCYNVMRPGDRGLPGDPRQVVTALRATADRLEQRIQEVEPAYWRGFMVQRLRWPWLGPLATRHTSTAASYFDSCARALHREGVLVVAAGSPLQEPPSAVLAESLLGTVHGTALCDWFWRSAGGPPTEGAPPLVLTLVT